MKPTRNPVRLIAVTALALICLLLVLQIGFSQRTYAQAIAQQQERQMAYEEQHLQDTVRRAMASLADLAARQRLDYQNQMNAIATLEYPSQMQRALSSPAYEGLHYAFFATPGNLSTYDAEVPGAALRSGSYYDIAKITANLSQHRLFQLANGSKVLLWPDENHYREQVTHAFLAGLGTYQMDGAYRSLWVDQVQAEEGAELVLRHVRMPSSPEREGLVLDGETLAYYGLSPEAFDTLLGRGEASYTMPLTERFEEEATQQVFAAYHPEFQLVVQAASRNGYLDPLAGAYLETMRAQLDTQTLVLICVAFLSYALILLALQRAGRVMRRAQEENEQKLALREQELSVATSKVERVYESLVGSGVLDGNIMHNHASVANWLDTRFEVLSRKSSEAILSGQLSTALVMVEIDNLMDINAEHGLEAGDAVLSSLSALMQEHTRKSDVVARWHEATFLLILHDISLKNALGRVEDLRSVVERMEIRHQELCLRVTITCGISMLLTADRNWKQVLGRAQRALGRGREASRNTVCHEIFQ